MDDDLDRDDRWRPNTANSGVARVALLALTLMNRRKGLTKEDLRNDVYGAEGEPDTPLTSIKRDGEKLRSCGLYIKETNKPQKVWQVDAERSYLGDAELSIEDSSLLQVLLYPLLNDDSFCRINDLRIALAKLDPVFDYDPVFDCITTSSRDDASPMLHTAIDEQKMVEFDYENAQGVRSHKTLAPYGIYEYEGKSYCVGAEEKDGALQETRRYRIARIDKNTIVTTEKDYAIPEDFDIADYPLLPFQISGSLGKATFQGQHPTDDRKALMEENGDLEMAEDDSFIWTVPVSSWEDAASYAIAHDLRPIAPEELVDAARACLEKVIQDV